MIGLRLACVCAATLLLGVVSCTKKDKEPPVITVNSPANESAYLPGDTFRLSVTYTDNEDLSQWHVNIHQAGGHSHGKVAADWEVDQTGDLAGKSETVQVDVSVPMDATLAEYHLEIVCLDVEGNEASTIVSIDVQ